MTRRFPAPWIVEPIPGGFKVRDATGQALAYVYAREEAAAIAKVLTMDEARAGSLRTLQSSRSCYQVTNPRPILIHNVFC